MSWWVEPKEEKTPMSQKLVEEAIEKHENSYKPVDLTNCIFEGEIYLTNRLIPYSLDFQYSIFKERLSFHSSLMKGAFIELTRAELQKGVYFTALKADNTTKWGSYSIFLRKAKIFGDISLNGAGPITTLAIYNNEYFGLDGKPYQSAGFLGTRGANIERIIVKGDEDILL